METTTRSSTKVALSVLSPSRKEAMKKQELKQHEISIQLLEQSFVKNRKEVQKLVMQKSFLRTEAP